MHTVAKKASKGGVLPGDRLAGMDFAAHNAEVKALWDAFNAGTAPRVPIIVGTNVRYFMFNASANPEGLDFRAYSEDPDAMFDANLRFARWLRFNLLQDMPLGMPERWQIAPNFQNYYEAAWFGCPVEYMDGQVPDTRPAFADCPERVMEKGLPDPLGGLMARGLEYYEHFRARAAGEEYLGRPIEVVVPSCGLSTDGPLTVACNLFGPEFVCLAMFEEPERLARLLDFITRATIARMAAWRQRFAMPVAQKNFGYADDSLALISVEAFREHVLPCHRMLCDALATPEARSIHLCGDATRHFLTLRDELNIQSFDTGFPVDFVALRRTLGPGVKILGGPHIELLRRAAPAQVTADVRRILTSGVLAGGRFVLREGNNLAPGTPLENLEAMYHAGRAYGALPAAAVRVF